MVSTPFDSLFLHLKQCDSTRINFFIELNLSLSNRSSVTTASMTTSCSSLVLSWKFSGTLGQASSDLQSHAGPVSHSLSFRASTVSPRVSMSAGFIFSFTSVPQLLCSPQRLVASFERNEAIVGPLLNLSNVLFDPFENHGNPIGALRSPTPKTAACFSYLATVLFRIGATVHFLVTKVTSPFLLPQIDNLTHRFQRSIWEDM